MYEEKDLPAVLREVVEKWDKEGLEFYLGPENIFNYQGYKLTFSTNIVFREEPGSWFAKTKDKQVKDLLQLSRRQIEDIATQLVKFYKPKSWSILLDYRCNYSCQMCPFQGEGYVGDYWGQRQALKRIVPKEEAFQYLDKLSANGVEKVCLSSPGELFLYPYWKEVTSYAAQKGLDVITITNGSMVTEKLAKEMKELGIQSVNVSLDALSQNVYAKVRSDKLEHYEAAMKAPIILKQQGIRVGVHFVKQKANIFEADKFLEFWKKQDVDCISMGNQTIYHDGFSKDAFDIKKDQFIHGICARYGSFMILNDGTVATCCEMPMLFKDDHSNGLTRIKFLEESYEDIVSKMNFQMSKPESPLKFFCKKCSLYAIPVYIKEKTDEWIVTRCSQEIWERNQFKNITEKLDKLINEWNEKGKTILIYGAGVHTDDLFNFTPVSRLNIKGIADKNRYGQRYFGYKIIKPTEILKIRPDIIIISSKAFQNEIYNEIKHFEDEGIQLIKLYD